MELLQQEKMAHVEELRQIHADINAVSHFHPSLIFIVKARSLSLEWKASTIKHLPP